MTSKPISRTSVTLRTPVFTGVRLFIIPVLLAVLQACSATDTRTEAISYGAGFPTTTEQPANEAPFAWHSIRFRMPRGADGSSNWNTDLMLAHKVIGPALLENVDALPLWRFHRRSAPDAAGHQFSFLFYSDTTTADTVFEWVKGEQLLTTLSERGLLLTTSYQHNAVTRPHDIAGTSDPSWSPIVQRQWTSFIMGVSATWLGLIEESVPPPAEEHESIDDILARYGEANSTISTLWYEEGQHAFLHHLSAVFGYRHMKIRKAIQF